MKDKLRNRTKKLQNSVDRDSDVGSWRATSRNQISGKQHFYSFHISKFSKSNEPTSLLRLQSWSWNLMSWSSVAEKPFLPATSSFLFKQLFANICSRPALKSCPEIANSEDITWSIPSYPGEQLYKVILSYDTVSLAVKIGYRIK